MKPRKPNSALRKIVEVLHNNKKYRIYIPGEKGICIKHTYILFIRKSKKDCPGINYTLIRGSLDCKGVIGRIRKRSKYGTKKN